MITKVNHIGVVVRDIDEAVKLYTDVLGLEVKHEEVMEDLKLRIAMIPVGESEIELLEPTDLEGQYAKFIEERGEGLHHVALEVSNIDDVLETLKKKGIPLIDQQPRRGVGGTRIAFLDSKGTKVILELVEPSETK